MNRLHAWNTFRGTCQMFNWQELSYEESIRRAILLLSKMGKGWTTVPSECMVAEYSTTAGVPQIFLQVTKSTSYINPSGYSLTIAAGDYTINTCAVSGDNLSAYVLPDYDAENSNLIGLLRNTAYGSGTCAEVQPDWPTDHRAVSAHMPVGAGVAFYPYLNSPMSVYDDGLTGHGYSMLSASIRTESDTYALPANLSALYMEQDLTGRATLAFDKADMLMLSADTTGGIYLQSGNQLTLQAASATPSGHTITRISDARYTSPAAMTIPGLSATAIDQLYAGLLANPRIEEITGGTAITRLTPEGGILFTDADWDNQTLVNNFMHRIGEWIPRGEVSNISISMPNGLSHSLFKHGNNILGFAVTGSVGAELGVDIWELDTVAKVWNAIGSCTVSTNATTDKLVLHYTEELPSVFGILYDNHLYTHDLESCAVLSNIPLTGHAYDNVGICTRSGGETYFIGGSEYNVNGGVVIHKLLPASGGDTFTMPYFGGFTSAAGEVSAALYLGSAFEFGYVSKEINIEQGYVLQSMDIPICGVLTAFEPEALLTAGVCRPVSAGYIDSIYTTCIDYATYPLSSITGSGIISITGFAQQFAIPSAFHLFISIPVISTDRSSFSTEKYMSGCMALCATSASSYSIYDGGIVLSGFPSGGMFAYNQIRAFSVEIDNAGVTLPISSTFLFVPEGKYVKPAGDVIFPVSEGGNDTWGISTAGYMFTPLTRQFFIGSGYASSAVALTAHNRSTPSTIISASLEGRVINSLSPSSMLSSVVYYVDSSGLPAGEIIGGGTVSAGAMPSAIGSTIDIQYTMSADVGDNPYCIAFIAGDDLTVEALLYYSEWTNVPGTYMGRQDLKGLMNSGTWEYLNAWHALAASIEVSASSASPIITGWGASSEYVGRLDGTPQNFCIASPSIGPNANKIYLMPSLNENEIEQTVSGSSKIFTSLADWRSSNRMAYSQVQWNSPVLPGDVILDSSSNVTATDNISVSGDVLVVGFNKCTVCGTGGVGSEVLDTSMSALTHTQGTAWTFLSDNSSASFIGKMVYPASVGAYNFASTNYINHALMTAIPDNAYITSITVSGTFATKIGYHHDSTGETHNRASDTGYPFFGVIPSDPNKSAKYAQSTVGLGTGWTHSDANSHHLYPVPYHTYETTFDLYGTWSKNDLIGGKLQGGLAVTMPNDDDPRWIAACMSEMLITEIVWAKFASTGSITMSASLGTPYAYIFKETSIKPSATSLTYAYSGWDGGSWVNGGAVADGEVMDEYSTYAIQATMSGDTSSTPVLQSLLITDGDVGSRLARGANQFMVFDGSSIQDLNAPQYKKIGPNNDILNVVAYSNVTDYQGMILCVGGYSSAYPDQDKVLAYSTTNDQWFDTGAIVSGHRIANTILTQPLGCIVVDDYLYVTSPSTSATNAKTSIIRLHDSLIAYIKDAKN